VSGKAITQAVVIQQASINEHNVVEKLALFNEDGSPVSFGGVGNLTTIDGDTPSTTYSGD
jgi:hypothetical protein